MALRVKSLASKTWKPKFHFQNPHKVGSKELNSTKLSSTHELCAHIHISLLHTIMINKNKKWQGWLIAQPPGLCS